MVTKIYKDSTIQKGQSHKASVKLFVLILNIPVVFPNMKNKCLHKLHYFWIKEAYIKI